jgi:methionine sulfoxide reductase catalytic subunit
MVEIDRSEITPEWVFMNRRKFMTGAIAVLAGAALSACSQGGPPGLTQSPTSLAATASQLPETSSVPITQTTSLSPDSTPHASQTKDELGSPLTPFATVTGYNNYYEFSLDKEGIGAIAQSFKTRPWQVQVGGLVSKPKTYTIEDLLGFPQEERIYRLRCVEAWSMVVPWVGFPLRSLLEAVQPTSDAKYVRFQSVLRPEEMPGQKDASFPWPYTEGLRLDEAMHDLTILATGLYGKPLQPECGAPLRLVVPWKYGFKCAKAIVKIDLVAEMPQTFWPSLSAEEYGFYANVNPAVPHPRWSQATERRIGEVGSRKTLLFNGYEQQVTPLYAGMDLRKNY